jgi:hypothetical protein
MTRYEYEELERRFSGKIKKKPVYSSERYLKRFKERPDFYNRALSDCKSVLKEIFERYNVGEMSEFEYRELQYRFSEKIKKSQTNKEDAYNTAVLACKSILSRFHTERSIRKAEPKTT